MNRIKVAEGLVRMASMMLQSKDTAEDIATDVAYRMDKGMSIRDAFRSIGYGNLYPKTRETDMPDGWESLPVQDRVKVLVKAIEKAMRRAAGSQDRKAQAAYEVLDSRFQDLVREFKKGGWVFGTVFSGKTHRVVGRAYARSNPVSSSFDIESALEKVKAQKVTYAEATNGILILEFIGNLGRTDTYVFTKTPYEDMVKGVVKEPSPRVSELRDQIVVKLEERGLRNLGERHAKAGEQFGIGDKARRLGVGRTYLMANYLLVEDRSQEGRRHQGSRWNMFKQWLLREVDDKLMDSLVSWIQRGPEMTEVRQKAYDKTMTGEAEHGGSSASAIDRDWTK